MHRGWVDADHCAIVNLLTEQSSDIAQGVDQADKKDQGAGDQGPMFGYATNETKTFYAHTCISQSAHAKTTQALMKKTLSRLRPDAKAQVAVIYDGDQMVGIHNVVLSTQYTGRSGARRAEERSIRKDHPTHNTRAFAVKRHKFLHQPNGQVCHRWSTC